MVRFKNRYLLFRFAWRDGRTDETLNEAALLQVIRESMQVNFGDYGLGSALQSLQVKHYCPVTGLCMVRAAREQHQQSMLRPQVWAAVSTVTDIRLRPVAAHLIKLAGTLATCKEAALAATPQLLSNIKTSQQAQLAEAAAERLRQLEL